MSELLSDEDLRTLTGATQMRKQAEVLDQHGIYYIRRRDNTITTTWHHVNHPSGVRSASDQPNFGAVG